jgi:hypothetical protein
MMNTRLLRERAERSEPGLRRWGGGTWDRRLGRRDAYRFIMAIVHVANDYHDYFARGQVPRIVRVAVDVSWR